MESAEILPTPKVTIDGKEYPIVINHGVFIKLASEGLNLYATPPYDAAWEEAAKHYLEAEKAAEGITDEAKKLEAQLPHLAAAATAMEKVSPARVNWHYPLDPPDTGEWLQRYAHVIAVAASTADVKFTKEDILAKVDITADVAAEVYEAVGKLHRRTLDARNAAFAKRAAKTTAPSRVQ